MDIVSHKIGEPFDDSPPVFQLIISDHIQFVDPNDYDLVNVKSIDPNYYFITSGDAVEKTKILLSHYIKLRDELLKECEQSNNQDLKNYTTAISFAIDQCATMLEHLKTAKGEHCFLETEWSDGVLHIRPKDPRPRNKI